MNNNRKQMLFNRQKNTGIIRRNRQLLKLDIVILVAGLLLSYMGYGNIGEPVLWLGVIIFAYSMLTIVLARKRIK